MKKLLLLVFITFFLFSCSVESSNIVDNEKIEISDSTIWSISVSDFKQKIWEDYTLIDIRTPEEVSERKIEWMDLNIDYYSPNFKNELDKLDKNWKYLIYCRSWNRSGTSLKIMKDMWFKEVYDLDWWINKW